MLLATVVACDAGNEAPVPGRYLAKVTRVETGTTCFSGEAPSCGALDNWSDATALTVDVSDTVGGPVLSLPYESTAVQKTSGKVSFALRHLELNCQSLQYANKPLLAAAWLSGAISGSHAHLVVARVLASPKGALEPVSCQDIFKLEW